MARVFVVEDELHAEWMGQFPNREAAQAYLARLGGEPDSIENRAPCTSWRTCGREYYLLEYEESSEPWKKIASEPAFEVRRGAVRPLSQAPPGDS